MAQEPAAEAPASPVEAPFAGATPEGVVDLAPEGAEAAPPTLAPATRGRRTRKKMGTQVAAAEPLAPAPAGEGTPEGASALPAIEPPVAAPTPPSVGLAATQTPEGVDALPKDSADQSAPEIGTGIDAARGAGAPALEDQTGAAGEDRFPDLLPPWEAFAAGDPTGTPERNGAGALLGASLPPTAPETDLLARALREMFPLPEDLGEPGDVLQETPNSVAETLEAQETAAASPVEDLSDDAADLRRGARGRRGRRGGRGRRRNGAPLAPGDEAAESVPALDESAAAPLAAAPLATAPVTPVGEPAINLFLPDSPPRPERNWRERGPRRQWGRTFSREERPVQLPPPKPSNGFRPGPIPRALPPLAAVVEPAEIEVLTAPAFQMPDLRIDEPLAPGETRTERLLEAQTRLMQAMLEQQTRQIEVLTATVSGLRQTVQHLSTARTQLPRTAIFVDAPNVCYAAENARVNIDFGRMLKYLSKDRQLVHAISYAPITDDVREGIRYETQRFVAPFLRTGYKLVTKPLKRFPDGSAKGNFDIELAIDIVTMSERLDIVVLVSGDSDFERMIELIQSKGVRVEVVAFASNVSTELVNVADVFIDINQHLEHMRAI